MKRVVWMPNWLGDAVMATPTISAIASDSDTSELVAICRPPVDQVLEGHPAISRCLIDQSGSKQSWSQKLAFVRSLRQERFDELILLTNSLRTAAIGRLAGIPRRIGFARDGRGWLLTDKLTPMSRKTPNPVIDEYNRLAAHTLGKTIPEHLQYELSLDTSSADEEAWNEIAEEFQLPEGHYACFNSGGAFGAAKHWPIESFAKLAQRIVQEMEIPIVMLCGPSERDSAAEFERLADHPMVHSLATKNVSVGLSKAMARHAGWMITTDSGPRHFAHAFEVPTLTIYGPTHIAWSNTYTRSAATIQLPVDCGPCQQRVCPQGHHRCMKDLTPDMVYESFIQLQEQVFNDLDSRSNVA